MPTLRSTAPEPVYCFATHAGGSAIDQDAIGGNPFASALIDLLLLDSIKLRHLRTNLVKLTLSKSYNLQKPEIRPPVKRRNWTLAPAVSGERRVALVLVFSDYSHFLGANSLPGARFDCQRIGLALRQAGFAVSTLLDADKKTVSDALITFRDASLISDCSVIYATGHGAEVAGSTYLIPGYYPIEKGGRALRSNAIRINELGALAQSQKLNIVFFGGCRNDPFRSN